MVIRWRLISVYTRHLIVLSLHSPRADNESLKEVNFNVILKKFAVKKGISLDHIEK